MTLGTNVTAVALFNNRVQAHAAIRALQAEGFATDKIGLLGKDGRATGLKGDPLAARWEEGTAIGAGAGAATGAGLTLAVLTGLIPPLGPVVAGGALVALLAGAGAGATIGTILGGVAGAAIPEDDYEYYANELREGKSMVTVEADDRAEIAETILRDNGGVLRESY